MLTTKRVLMLTGLPLLGGLFYLMMVLRMKEMPYSRLKIGMPAAEVKALFGGPPTYVFKVKGHTVWYIAEARRKQPFGLIRRTKTQPYKGAAA